jgi:hypothetical protein
LVRFIEMKWLIIGSVTRSEFVVAGAASVTKTFAYIGVPASADGTGQMKVLVVPATDV